jgi:aspartate aminotransferase
MISDRIKRVGVSKTLAIDSKVKMLKEQGEDIINLTAGQPDFNMPNSIKKEAKKSIDNNFTRYTDVAGCLPLRKVICEKFKKENNITYAPENIIVSCGAKHSLFNAIMATINQGDEVLIIKPFWTSYPEMVSLARGKSVFVNSKKDFQLDIENINKSISKKTKMIILNSPSNPAGVIYRKEDLKEIVTLAVKHNFLILSDEIYEKLIYDSKTYSIASLSKDAKERTITINGVSKSHAMTGLRIGYAAGNKELIQAMKKIQSHSTSNPTSTSQMAAIEAIKGNQKHLKKWLKEFKKRRDFVVETLNNIKGVTCAKPEGAFYVFPNVKYLFKNGMKNSSDLSNVLLDKAKVAVVTGDAFGSKNHIRISYSSSMKNLKEGMNRIKKFVEQMK